MLSMNESIAGFGAKDFTAVTDSKNFGIDGIEKRGGAL